MRSRDFPRTTKINKFSEKGSAVKYHCFVIENLCDKSGKVVHTKSLLRNFTLKIKCFYKPKYITMILT